jgi:hypothetical protein
MSAITMVHILCTTLVAEGLRQTIFNPSKIFSSLSKGVMGQQNNSNPMSAAFD